MKRLTKICWHLIAPLSSSDFQGEVDLSLAPQAWLPPVIDCKLEVRVHEHSGQSYKHFTLVNYNSRVVPDWKIPHIRTLES